MAHEATNARIVYVQESLGGADPAVALPPAKYPSGTLLMVSDAGKVYLCMRDTAGVASWVQVNPPAGVPSSRTISTTAPLTGGGDLSANRTFALSYDSTLHTNAGVLSVQNLLIAGEAQGDVLIRGAAAWQSLPAGAVGSVLVSNGAGANPSWNAPTVTAAQISDATATGRSVLTAADAAAARTAIGAGTGNGDVTLAGTNTFTADNTFNAHVSVPNFAISAVGYTVTNNIFRAIDNSGVGGNGICELGSRAQMYAGTIAQITAMPGPVAGMIALATDATGGPTIAIYTGAAWVMAQVVPLG